jgi:2,3-bisphosphoglycerate-independent phosphoglycerate mutase
MLMGESAGIISSSKKIKESKASYKGEPESVWLWGGGRRPAMETLNEKFSLSGYTISAVDLIHGIGKAAGLKSLHVDGATGYLDTNYKGKSEALARGLKDGDLVFLHVEAPDESGHEGNLEHKLKAIEDFDSKIVGPALEILKSYDDFVLLVMPDHPTPIKVRTHTPDAVPFCIYSSANLFEEERNKFRAESYNEKDAANTGLIIDKGSRPYGNHGERKTSLLNRRIKHSMKKSAIIGLIILAIAIIISLVILISGDDTVETAISEI